MVISPINSFPPIVHTQSRVLILGSIPGKASLRQQEYYAHPRNLFWLFIESAVKCPISTYSYNQKITTLQQHGIALWDVLQECEREGSLDSNIKAHSQKVNEFDPFLAQYSSIKTVLFNGKKAYQTFQTKVIKPNPSRYSNLTLVPLPSSSPANASIPKAIKYAHWSEALKVITSTF